MDFFNFFNLSDLRFNIFGEFVSAIISLVLIINIVTTFTWSSRKERLFFLGALSCFLSCVFDIFSVFTISHYNILPTAVNTVISSLYFISLVLIPFSMAGYAYEVSYAYREKEKPIFYVLIAIFVAYLVIMILNLKTGWVFKFTPEYTRGSLRYITYIMTVVAMMFVEVMVIPNRSSMASKLYVTMILYPLVAFAVLLIQLFNERILCTGTASIAGILFAYMSIQFEMSQFDSITGLMTEKKLEKHIMLKNNSGVLFVLSIDNMNMIQSTMKTSDLNRLMLSIGKEFTKHFQRYCYHISTDRFAAIGNSIEEVKEYSKLISDFIINENENNKELSIPMEFYSAAVEFSKKKTPSSVSRESDAFSNIMEIINNLLRKAKYQGSREVSICDESILNEMSRKRIIYEILKKELTPESDKFQVWYQPIYSIKDNKFVYMEALSRLLNTQLGNISPGEFIEVAESKGLISQLGNVAFQKICKFISENLDTVQGVSVNFSAEQISSPDIVQSVLSTIGEYNLEPSRIIIEITESMEMYSSEIVVNNIQELAAAGLKFYLDDFGTGFSNLSKVVSLPFSTIKMDRTLVLYMEQNPKNYILFENLVKTFKAASFNVLVEGVETEKQKQLVNKAGADYIQGFYYSRPLPPEECLQKLCEE